MKRRLLAVLGVLVLAAMSMPVFASGEQEPVQDSGKIRFGFSAATLDNVYFVEVANGFKARCEELGIEAVVVDAKYDSTLQNNQIENFIAMGCKGICVAPVDQRGLESVTQKAIDAGIIVVSEAQKVANASGNVIVDDYGYGVVNGTNAAKWINNKLNGKAEVLLLTLDHVESVKLRGDGMEDVIGKECPDSVVVARQYAESMEKAVDITSTILTANPDVRVISCVNDQLALGALAAVQSMGIKDDNFYIGGADYTEEAQAKIASPGSYFRVTVDIGPKQAGIDCVDMIYDGMVNGPKGEDKYFDMISHWQDGCGITESTPVNP